MKYLIEFNPPVEVKNEVETNPALLKKMRDSVERMKPLAAWFTFRRGYFVLEAESIEELTRKTAAFFFIWKTDPIISPAISMEEFGKVIEILGEEGKRLQA